MVTAPDQPASRRRVDPAYVAGMVGVLIIAVVLYTRFSIDQWLWRDETIYAYGGQQLAHGVPPYASIFDPKTPLATIIAGLAALLARALGTNDIPVIRLAFFVCSVVTVLAVFLLANRLWRSVVAGMVAAVVFASFPVFAAGALGGPLAKTPGIMFAVLCMWLLVRRDWIWAGMAGSAAYLVWQPLLLIYPVAALAVPVVVANRDGRWRAVAKAAIGVAIPLVLIGVYFAATGAFGKLIEATLIFPLTGIHQRRSTLTRNVTHIVHVVRVADGHGEAVVLAAGIGCLVALSVVLLVRGRHSWRETLRQPLLGVVLVTFLYEVGISLYYFQGPPDTLPFTPYAALGLGGGVAAGLGLGASARSRRAVTAAALAAAAALTAVSWIAFDHRNNHLLIAEYSDACGLNRILGTSGGLWSLGDPTPLVLTHRTNPDRFIYLEENVSDWKIHHTRGGFEGWVGQIAAAHPTVVPMMGWHGPNFQRMTQSLLSLGYTSTYLGRWHLYVLPAAQTQAARAHVLLTHQPTHVAVDDRGQPLPSTANCTRA
jgi:hypothetical protein